MNNEAAPFTFNHLCRLSHLSHRDSKVKMTQNLRFLSFIWVKIKYYFWYLKHAIKHGAPSPFFDPRTAFAVLSFALCLLFVFRRFDTIMGNRKKNWSKKYQNNKERKTVWPKWKWSINSLIRTSRLSNTHTHTELHIARRRANVQQI